MAHDFRVYIGSKQKGPAYESFRVANTFAAAAARINPLVFVYQVVEGKENMPIMSAKWVEGKRV
jgi:hypothetical protein